jgi:hypothetical protein
MVSRNKKIKIYILQERTILRKDLKKYRRIQGYANSKSGKRERIYTKQKRQRKLKTVKPSSKKPVEEEKNYYRYSVAYALRRYGKTFRAVYVSDKQQNEGHIITELKKFVVRKMAVLNTAKYDKIYSEVEYIGIESERIGTNDFSPSELNRMRFYTD